MNGNSKHLAIMVLLPVFGFASADERVFLQATFESGQIQNRVETVDGFYIGTLPEPQIADEYIQTGAGGFGPETNWDTKVVTSERVGAELVLPRSGRYFLRSAIYYDKNYQGLNGGVDSKPRSAMVFTTPDQRLDFDQEGWIGFSVFLPSNWEHELGVQDHRGGTVLFSINSGPSATLMGLTQYVPRGETTARWFLHLQTSDSTATESGEYDREWLDLGTVVPDLGVWTDFVIRVRANPFTQTTNPFRAGIPRSRDQTYEGNRGILQIWKSEGQSREMTLMVDRVNVPVGMVPLEGDGLAIRWQLYKYGWRRNPTTVKGPIWVGFDEIRYGITELHGTRYEDVAADRVAAELSAPRPPRVSIE
jgi:hypothetical protein